jgi:hypothetical protein
MGVAISKGEMAMDGHSCGYPDDRPDRELRGLLNRINLLEYNIRELTDKLRKARQIVLDDTLSIAEKKKIVSIDMHCEAVQNSLNNLATFGRGIIKYPVFGENEARDE